MVTYLVDATEIAAWAENFFLGDPEVYMEDVLTELSSFTHDAIAEVCPSGLASGRNARTNYITYPSLAESITEERLPNAVSIGPTKKVGGYDLGMMLEEGSYNQATISVGGGIGAPVGKQMKIQAKAGWQGYKPMLYFFSKGKWWAKESVTRGIIPPIRFVGKAYDIVLGQMESIVSNVLSSYGLEEGGDLNEPASVEEE